MPKHRPQKLALPWERRPLSARIAGLGWRRAVLLLATIAVLAAMAMRVQERRRVQATRNAIMQVKTALGTFLQDVGRCPENDIELLHPPVRGAHYLRRLPLDGWGRALRIECPGRLGEDFSVMSAGPSGSFLRDDNLQ